MSIKIDLCNLPDKSETQQDCLRQMKSNKLLILQAMNRLQEHQEIVNRLIKTIMSFLMENEEITQRLILTVPHCADASPSPSAVNKLPDFLSKLKEEMLLFKQEFEPSKETTNEFSFVLSKECQNKSNALRITRQSKSALSFSFGNNITFGVKRGEENIDDHEEEAHLNINIIEKPHVSLKDEAIKYRSCQPGMG